MLPELGMAYQLVVDTTTGMIVERIASPLLGPTIEAMKALLFPRHSEAFGAVRLNLEEHIQAQRAQDAGYVERLERTLQRGEANGLVAAFVRAASQATTEDRMQMLAAAAAGVFTPDLESEMRSRVARAVEQLEPSDIVQLRRIRGRFAGFVRTLPSARMRRVMGIGSRDHSALIAAGCVRTVVEPVTHRSRSEELDVQQSFEVTALGAAVLKTLEGWEGGETGSPGDGAEVPHE